MFFLAHRGASQLAPENTLCAFRKAEELFRHAEEKTGRKIQSGMELDVQLSGVDNAGQRDLLLFHDDTLVRTTDFLRAKVTQGKRSKKRLVDLDSAFLRQLDAGAWKGKNFLGERIPLFKDFLGSLSPEIRLMEIEAKFPKGFVHKNSGYAQMLLELLKTPAIAGRAFVASFDVPFLSEFKSLLEKVGLTRDYPLGLCTGRSDKKRQKSLDLIQPQYVVLEYQPGMEKIIKTAHEDGRKVLIWTVNDLRRIQRCIDHGADGVISNRPELLLSMPEHMLRHFSDQT